MGVNDRDAELARRLAEKIVWDATDVPPLLRAGDAGVNEKLLVNEEPVSFPPASERNVREFFGRLGVEASDRYAEKFRVAAIMAQLGASMSGVAAPVTSGASGPLDEPGDAVTTPSTGSPASPASVERLVDGIFVGCRSATARVTYR